MRDIDIRQRLYDTILKEHVDAPDTIILDEFGICGHRARADVAVVNGELNGYEIKSERDSLHRLPLQMEIYNRCFDRMTLVSAGKHILPAQEIVPAWWGLVEARTELEGSLSFHVIRNAAVNPSLDPVSIAGLLWRDEALAILKAWKADRGVRTKRMAIVAQRLAETVPQKELRAAVREAMKRRTDWVAKHDERRTSLDLRRHKCDVVTHADSPQRLRIPSGRPRGEPGARFNICVTL